MTRRNKNEFDSENKANAPLQTQWINESKNFEII